LLAAAFLLAPVLGLPPVLTEPRKPTNATNATFFRSDKGRGGGAGNKKTDGRLEINIVIELCCCIDLTHLGRMQDGPYAFTHTYG
jgi:hypothetical protein